MNFFKIHDKYGKELRFPNTKAHSVFIEHYRNYRLLHLEAPAIRKDCETSVQPREGCHS